MALETLFTNIADAIREKDGTSDTIVANSFPDRIRAIPSGSKPSTPLDPKEVYKNTRPADWLQMPTPQNDEIYLLFHIPDGVSSLLAFTVTCTGNYTVALGTVENGVFVQQSSTSLPSGNKYEAELFASNFGNKTSDGMKQCMVKVSGTDILTWEPSTHSKKTSPSNYCGWNIVEIACKLPNGTVVRCGSNTINKQLIKLRFFSWHGENAATDMSNMFQYCYSLTAIPELDTSQVTDMSYMFNSCYSLTAIPELDTSQVTNMSYMFYNCYSLTAIPELDTSQVTNMGNMFNGCYLLTAIPELDTSQVTNMGRMFNNCYSLTAIPELDTSQVTNMSYMFYNCYSLTAIPELDTSQVTNMGRMFYNCYSLTAIPELDTSQVTDMSYMFNSCYLLTAIPELDTSQVTNMSYMFYNCYSLTAIPELDTSQVTNMGRMFYNCYSLTAIPELDTSQVTDMSYMFNSCYLLTAIPELDTSQVTNMSYMFNSCYSLTAIPELDTSQVTNMSNAFNGCYSLAKLTLKPTIIGWAGYAISLLNCSLSHQAIVDFFTSLPTITSSKAITLTGNHGVSELTNAEKAIATGKNWTLTL